MDRRDPRLPPDTASTLCRAGFGDSGYHRGDAFGSVVRAPGRRTSHPRGSARPADRLHLRLDVGGRGSRSGAWCARGVGAQASAQGRSYELTCGKRRAAKGRQRSVAARGSHATRPDASEGWPGARSTDLSRARSMKPSTLPRHGARYGEPCRPMREPALVRCTSTIRRSVGCGSRRTRPRLTSVSSTPVTVARLTSAGR